MDEAFVDFLKEEKRKRDERIAAKRPQMLVLLKELGVERLDAQYDGYGDSGNVHTVEFIPECEPLPEANKTELEDFIWEVAYNQCPGFEINDGGYGRLIWDVAGDKIDITHTMRIMEEETETYENV